MIKELLSYYKRRIWIPVKSDDLVLDIGSGDRPHWRADILLDKYIDDDYSSQRSGSGKIKFNKPIVEADIEKMPFKNKVFDYVICSHILEHVCDPGKAIEEIIRVGKRGYIELPFAGMQKIRDFETHLWYCRLKGNTLEFEAKDRPCFDEDIDNFISQNSSGKKFQNAFFFGDDHCLVRLYWKNSINFKIIGKPNPQMLNTENVQRSIPSLLTFYFVRVGQFILSLTQIYKKRRKLIKSKDIFLEKYRHNILDFYLQKKIYPFKLK